MSKEITIVQGSGFVVSDELGDILPGTTQGYFYADTRFLSTYRLLVNGERPRPLTSREIDAYSASFVSTNPISDSLPRDICGIIRHRFVGEGLHEDLEVENYSNEALALTVSLEFGADFADIFDVRHGGSPPALGILSREEGFDFAFTDASDTGGRRVLIVFSKPPRIEGHIAHFDLELSPRGSRRFCLDVHPVMENVRIDPVYRCDNFGAGPAPQVVELRTSWTVGVPEVRAEHDGLRHGYKQAMGDIGSLHFPVDGEIVLAAGLPWFIAMFGRDSLITAYQLLGFERGTAAAILRALARYQGRKLDPFTEEQPGKILHELRVGELAAGRHIPFAKYYGTVDATPLFLILLAETYRWTGDLDLVRELFPAAEAALGWIDEYGDLDGDGFVEYPGKSAEGLSNQGWKDSGDSIRFADGRFAEGPIALVEAQGYVYAAKQGMAELCEALGRLGRARKLREEAGELKARFHQAFWMEKENFLALALDGKKRQVDSVTSNAGHCLWSGIVEKSQAEHVAQRLVAPDMFSGWGIRTMSTEMAAYNPISYHNGTVWPHDTSLALAGLARYGFREEANRVAMGLLDAVTYFPSYRLPELFAGYPRGRPPFPVEYPTANSPQAWAAGSLPLILKTFLGLKPDPASQRLLADPVLPPEVPRLELSGVRALGRRFSVSMGYEQVIVYELPELPHAGSAGSTGSRDIS